MKFGKIDPISLAVTLGALAGLSAIFSSLMVMIFNKGKPFNGIMGTIYFNYELTFIQCLLTGVSALVGTFISSYLVALAYNYLSKQLKQTQ